MKNLNESILPLKAETVETVESAIPSLQNGVLTSDANRRKLSDKVLNLVDGDDLRDEAEIEGKINELSGLINAHNKQIPAVEKEAEKNQQTKVSRLDTLGSRLTKMLGRASQLQVEVENAEAEVRDAREDATLADFPATYQGLLDAVRPEVKKSMGAPPKPPVKPLALSDEDSPDKKELGLKVLTYLLTAFFGGITGLSLGVITHVLNANSFNFGRNGFDWAIIPFFAIGTLVSNGISVIFKREVNRYHLAKLSGDPTRFPIEYLALPLCGILALDYAGIDFLANTLQAEKAHRLGHRFTPTPPAIILLAAAFGLCLYLLLNKMLAESAAEREHRRTSRKTLAYEYELQLAKYEEDLAEYEAEADQRTRNEVASKKSYRHLSSAIKLLENAKGKLERQNVEIVECQSSILEAEEESILGDRTINMLRESVQKIEDTLDELFELRAKKVAPRPKMPFLN